MRPNVIALVALVIAMTSAPALAQWPDLTERAPVEKTGTSDVALIVSIEDYAFLPDVPGASKNAAAWERFLREDLGVPSVLVLKDQQAVREEILEFARRAAGATSSEGRLWVVFIGHGAPNKSGNDGLLIGADGQQTMSSMTARSVSRSELLEVLKAGGQADTVAIIDACFSGRDPSGEALAKGVQPVLPVNATLPTPGNTVVLTAASANEVAGQLPDEERPAFSYLLLGAMRGWADDGDAIVTAEEATAFARNELLGVPGRRQTPQISGAKALHLTRGASESRPARAAVVTPAGSQEPVVTSTLPAGMSTPTPDGARQPFYVLGGVGVASPSLSGASVLVAADIGVKLNALLGLDSEWRVGVHGAYFSVSDPDAPGVGDTVPFDSGGSITVESGDTVNDTREHYLKVGVGPGFAFRGPTSVMYFDSSAGLASGVGGGCNGWTATTGGGGRVVNCSVANQESAPYVGLRGGLQFGFVDIAAHADLIMGDAGFMIGATAGLAFDN